MNESNDRMIYRWYQITSNPIMQETCLLGAKIANLQKISWKLASENLTTIAFLGLHLSARVRRTYYARRACGYSFSLSTRIMA